MSKTAPATSAALSAANVSTMTSIEIARLCNKEPAKVHLDIERILNEVEIDSRNFASEYKAKNGQTYKCYNLPRRECDLVVSGYVAKYRLAIIDRWQELEEQQVKPLIPQTLPEALRLAADLAEENSKLLPKADALDRLSNTEGSHCMRDSAKALSIRPIDLTKWLHANRWIYKKALGKNWIAYQDRIQSGYLEHKITPYGKDDSGNEKVSAQVRVTAKGLTKLSLELNKELS